MNNNADNKTNIEQIDKSELFNKNDLLKEDKIQTKKINYSPSRLNIEIENVKINEKGSEANKNENCLKYSDDEKNDKNLKERIELHLKSKKSKTNRNKFVKFSRFDFIMSFIPCKRIKNHSLIERERLILTAEEKILEYLDVCTYTKFFENFKKLKSIL